MSSIIKYTPFIEKEVRAPRSSIQPMNIYRISSYKTVEGKLKSMGGSQSALVFVIGLHPNPLTEKQINCLKISEIEPNDFLRWLKRIVDPRKKDNIDEHKHLSELLIRSDKTGQKLFEQYVKPSGIVYKKSNSIYRTYDLGGIRYAQEVHFNKDILKGL